MDVSVCVWNGADEWSRKDSSDEFNFFFFKQNTAYVLRISDWSSDVCSSDLARFVAPVRRTARDRAALRAQAAEPAAQGGKEDRRVRARHGDRKSTRLNSSH